MPTITITNNAADQFVKGLFTVDYNLISPGTFSNTLLRRNASASDAAGRAAILLMKGTIPASFSEIPTYASRSADILVSFDTSVNSAIFTSTTSGLTTPPSVRVSSDYASPTAAGTVTWFWWIVRSATDTDGSKPLLQQIIGTVGPIGSGADLIMKNVNVQLGAPVKINNLVVNIPTTWTY